MASVVAENRPHEYLALEHQGMIQKDTTKIVTENAIGWEYPSFENYTFKNNDGATDVLVEVNVANLLADDFCKFGQLPSKS